MTYEIKMTNGGRPASPGVPPKKPQPPKKPDKIICEDRTLFSWDHSVLITLADILDELDGAEPKDVLVVFDDNSDVLDIDDEPSCYLRISVLKEIENPDYEAQMSGYEISNKDYKARLEAWRVKDDQWKAQNKAFKEWKTVGDAEKIRKEIANKQKELEKLQSQLPETERST